MVVWLGRVRVLGAAFGVRLLRRIQVNEFKLIVAGGRDFDGKGIYRAMFIIKLMELANETLANKNVSIVTGMARGADMMAYDFCVGEGLKDFTLNNVI